MKLAFKSLPQLLNHFKDEAICIQYLEEQRWDGKPTCPHCAHSKVYITNRGYKCASKTCHKKFSVTVGTVFENSKIKLSMWFAAIYLATAHKKGISSLQLSRDLGITQKTAWFMLHRIREMMRVKQPTMLTGEVQAWLHGPVSRKLYDYVKTSNAKIYSDLSLSWEKDKQQKFVTDFESKLNPTQLELINDILEEFIPKTAYQLECITHEELPWIEARKGYGAADNCEVEISKDTMQKYYRAIIFGNNDTQKE